jgi:hypothetical protein
VADFVDRGPKELTVIADEQVVADYEVWHLAQ